MIKYLVVMLLFVSTLHADQKELWAKYNTLKATHYMDISATVKNYLDIADVAKQLKRDDIAAWNYDNAAYTLIKEFRKETKWDNFNKQISQTKGITPRLLKRNEFRDVIDAHWSMMIEAQGYLQQAVGLGYNADKEKFNDSDMERKVNSNQDFIKWAAKFADSRENPNPGLAYPTNGSEND